MNGSLAIDRTPEGKAHAATVMPVAEEFVTVCAWCERVRVDDETWIYGVCEAPVTHGICPSCLAVMKEELQRYISMQPAPVSHPA